MSKQSPRKGRPSPADRLPRIYEGPDVLAPLLEASGCELTVDEVVDEFACALEEGTPAGEIIPLLWELEPRFPDPATAKRTFQNLFGLWDAVDRELTAEHGPLVDLGELDPDAPLSSRQVDQASGRLDALAEKDWRKARDRFDNHQSDVATFVFERLAETDPVVIETAIDLAFETWWILEQSRGKERVPRASRAALTAGWDAEDDGGEPEPGLAGLATAALWEQAADEDRPLPEAAIPLAERALKAVRRALSPGR